MSTRQQSVVEKEMFRLAVATCVLTGTCLQTAATAIFFQDFNPNLEGVTLSPNSGVLGYSALESAFSGTSGSLSLEAENTGTSGNPEIISVITRTDSNELLRISFDYYRVSGAGAQTFFLQDAEAPIEGNGNGIQLQLNGFNAGEVVNYGSGTVLATLAQDTWYRFEVTAVPVSSSVKTFDLAISDTNGVVAAATNLAFRYNIDSYDAARWFFNATGDQTLGHCRYDNILIENLPVEVSEFTLNSNGGTLDYSDQESPFTYEPGSQSLEAENTGTNGNPEIIANLDGDWATNSIRIVFDYCRVKNDGAQTFFLKDTQASIEGSGIGIQLPLNEANAGNVVNYGSSTVLATLSAGTWYWMMIEAVPEGTATKTFNLTVSDTNGLVAVVTNLPFRDDIDSYDVARWFFNTTGDSTQGHCRYDSVLVETLPVEYTVLYQGFDSETTGFVLSENDGSIDGGGVESGISGVINGASLDAANSSGDGPWNPSIRTENMGVSESVLPVKMEFDYFVDSVGGNQTFMLRSGSTPGIHLVLVPGTSGGEIQNVTTGSTDLGIILSEDQWVYFEVTACSVLEPSKTYNLKIKNSSGSVLYDGTLPFRNNITNYDDLQWNFNTVGSDATGRFLLDNVIVSKVYAGSEWHVATDGDDAGDGTSVSPFGSIQKAADVADAGDTVYIHGGTYRETVVPPNSGTAADPIVFRPYFGEEVVVSGLDPVDAAWTEYSNGIYKASVSLSLGTENQVFRRPSTVSFWRDRSGNENHAVQTNLTSRLAAVGTTNVVFDGINDFLETPVGHLENGGFLMVGNFSAQGANNSSVVLSWQESGSSPGTCYSFENYTTDTVISRFYNSNGGVFSNYTDGVAGDMPSSGGWHFIGGTVTGNGADSASFMRIGGNHNDSNFPDGGLCELIIWDEAISDADRQKLEGWLAHKWGMEGNLDSAHPYKAEPPASFDPAALSAVAAWYDAGSMTSAEEMMFEARWPNSLDVWNPAWALTDSGSTPSNLVDSALPDYDWTGADIWIYRYPAWALYGQQVLGYGSGYLTTEDNAAWENHQLKENTSYYVQGCLDALDIEGEWYYDESSETLYVHAGESRPESDIMAKTRMNAFVLDGLSYVELHGIRIKGATVSTDEYSSHLVMDGLDMQYPYFSSDYDDWQLTKGLVLNGDGHEFCNSELAWASGSGLIINGNDAQVINNYIHDCDFIGSYAAPLKVGVETANGVISHNTITMAGRSCIAFSWPMRDHLIQYNDLSHAGQLTQDLGMTYVNICEAGGTEIRYNWVHDNDAGHIPSGIYFDHGAKNLLIHHNAIWGVERGGLHINQYAMGILVFNNTITSDDSGYLSKWGNEWPDDMYGCKLVNNVFTDVLDTDGEEIEIADNTTNYTGLVDYKYLTTGSAPVDAGRVIPGITDSWSGSAPDQGAYELGGTDWQVGHDFRNEPVVDSELSDCPYKNRIENSCFEWSSLSPWTTTGSDVELNVQSVSQSLPLTQTAMGGKQSLRLGSGTNRVQQVVTKLLSDAVYEFRGRLRADSGESVRLRVSDCGAADVVSAAVSGNAPDWSDTRIRFVTASDETTATVYAEKISGGTGDVYIDDFSVIYQCRVFSQDFNANTNGVTLNANSGVLDLTGSESAFSDVSGGSSLNAENTSTNGNPEILVEGIDMSAAGPDDPLRITFDYCRVTGSGTQTFFLQDTETPIEANGNGIQLQLNAANAGQGINYGSSTVLATLATNTWYRFEIFTVPETNAVKTFDLTIRDTNGVVAAVTNLPFRYNIDSYDSVRWFFNTQNSNVQGQFYLDNVSVSGVVVKDSVWMQAESQLVAECLAFSPYVDSDGDSMSDWAECLAGTDPLCADSSLEIFSVASYEPGEFVLQWWSVADKSYAVLANSNLVGGSWVPVCSGIPATPPMNTETVDVNSADNHFFKIELE